MIIGHELMMKIGMLDNFNRIVLECYETIVTMEKSGNVPVNLILPSVRYKR